MPPEGVSGVFRWADQAVLTFLFLSPLYFAMPCPGFLLYFARVSAGVFGNEGMNLHGNRICVKSFNVPSGA